MRNLGHLEAAVMVMMWSSGRPALVRDVLEGLRRDRDLAYTTVMTVMDNLHRKGMLARERDGRAYRYRAVLSRQEYTARLMEEALASSDDRSATLLHFVDHITADELATLRAIVAEARNGDREPDR